MPTARFFIGIDDTDAEDSIATGALARELQLHLARTLPAEALGVTRHQLALLPEIAFSSHNSAACVEILADVTPAALVARCLAFLQFFRHPGANPGLCVATDTAAPAGARDFARRAQAELVTEAEAREVAEECGFDLHAAGGTGRGVIGALCAVLLRQTGNDGRFLALGGIRALPKRNLPVATILESTPIAAVRVAEGPPLGPETAIDATNGVRPELLEGRAILVVAAEGGRYFTKGSKKEDQ
ncbi:MAG: hypothetical protein FJZ01_19160 [Candidatus Sericytochromatia bacterium]|nr:hypothetical protein [Candidatus Tanganyikabacteria bacterium]